MNIFHFVAIPMFSKNTVPSNQSLNNFARLKGHDWDCGLQ
jgi:hypothetical protein